MEQIRNYLVILETGEYEDYFTTPVFVTEDYALATKYINKFKRLVRKRRDLIKSCVSKNKLDCELLFWYRFIIYNNPNMFIKGIEKR